MMLRHSRTPVDGQPVENTFQAIDEYSGAQLGIYEPISSHRLENIRMGIQDYQLLTMLEELVGKEAADEMVAMVTTDVVTYTDNDDYLKAVRVMLLEKVAEALN